MQAVILAAGMGSRLNPMTGGGSKALVDIGGRPLLLHQLEALADHGIGPVLVLVGHEAQALQAVIGDRAEVMLNERFAETNSLYSLWLARHWIKGPFLLLNCDLFFDPRILDELIGQSGNVLAYDSTSSRGREQTKVAIKARRVVDLGKDLPPSSASGESLGLLKFDAEGSLAMLSTADHLITEGHENAWVIAATRAVCQQVTIQGLNVAGHAWTEIDFPYDLDVARREVWPVIWRGRWRKQVYWKRTRWAAAVLVALALAMLGWYSNTRVGPASIDWETVDLVGGKMVRVERADGPQRWWNAALGVPVTATVSGAEVDVQLRLVHPPGARDTLRYVVGVTMDGEPTDWRALNSQTDTLVRLGEQRFGDRDHLRFTLSPGVHTIGVVLTAGHSDRMLVRVRQAALRDD
jgi:L-glutamine-phosphate cytidylyltransferase